MYLQRLDHSSQDDRCASKILKGPCALGEASTGDSYTEGNPKNLSTHWQAIHFLHCKRLEWVLLGGDLQRTTELWKKDSRELQRTGPFHLHDAMTYRKIFPTRPKKSGGICLYIKPQAGSVAKLPSPTWSAALCFRSKMSVRDSWSAALYRRCLTWCSGQVDLFFFS